MYNTLLRLFVSFENRSVPGVSDEVMTLSVQSCWTSTLACCLSHRGNSTQIHSYVKSYMCQVNTFTDRVHQIISLHFSLGTRW